MIHNFSKLAEFFAHCQLPDNWISALLSINILYSHKIDFVVDSLTWSGMFRVQLPEKKMFAFLNKCQLA